VNELAVGPYQKWKEHLTKPAPAFHERNHYANVIMDDEFSKEQILTENQFNDAIDGMVNAPLQPTRPILSPGAMRELRRLHERDDYHRRGFKAGYEQARRRDISGEFTIGLGPLS
jgi:hypothetical protein